MTSEYTDIIARFCDDVVAATFAGFITSLGISCDVTEIWDSTRIERYAIRVQRCRIPELRRALDLKPVVTRIRSIDAQVIAGRLARDGVPCYIGGLHLDPGLGGDSDVPIRETTEGMPRIDCMIAVPGPFVREALRLVNVAPLTDEELTRLALADEPRNFGGD